MNYIKSIFAYFFCLGLGSLLVSCDSSTHLASIPKAQLGEMDLSDWNFAERGGVALDGDWAFYWGQLLSLEALQSGQKNKLKSYAKVPGVWNDTKIKEYILPGQGYATYHLKLKLGSHSEQFALKINTFATAANIYVNGLKISTSGRVDSLAPRVRPAFYPQIIRLDPGLSDLDIIVQVANFHYTKGGIWDSLRIGPLRQIKQARKRVVLLAIFLVGSIFIMGIYNLFQFLTYTKDRASLYFSFVCFLVALRILCTDEYLITRLIHLDWIWVLRLEYLSYYWGILCFGAFMHALFRAHYYRFFYWFLLAYSWSAILSIFVLPSKVFTGYVFYHQCLTLFYALFFTMILIVAIRKRNKIAWPLLIGWLVLISMLFNDVLHTNHYINTGNYTPFGLLAFLFSYGYILTKKLSDTFEGVEKLNITLQDQNNNLEEEIIRRTEDLSEVNEVLSKSNRYIEKKNKMIQSSIQYARRIQESSLPDVAEIQRYLPESFIFFKPKEVISGDFYWFGIQNKKVLLATVDCTGHGVPGAFMSMVANDLLGEIMLYEGVQDVAKVLALLDHKLQHRLHQTSMDRSSNYGLDIALISIDLDKKQVEFAGANRPLFYLRNHKIRVIPGEKIFIGRPSRRQAKEEPPFKKHVIPIHLTTTLYLCSDGFTNQLGGGNKKKYLSKRFKKLLQLIHKLPMEEQPKVLEEALELWQSPQHLNEIKYPQTDDILVLGLNLNFANGHKNS